MAGIFSYAKTLWQDGVTAITAARLNHIEQGISDAADSIKTLEDSVSLIAVDGWSVESVKFQVYTSGNTNYFQAVVSSPGKEAVALSLGSWESQFSVCQSTQVVYCDKGSGSFDISTLVQPGVYLIVSRGSVSSNSDYYLGLTVYAKEKVTIKDIATTGTNITADGMVITVSNSSWYTSYYLVRLVQHSVSRLYVEGVSDVDNPPNCVMFRTAASPEGLPNDFGSNVALVLQQNPGSEYAAQLAFSFGGKIALRTRFNSMNWQDWKYLTPQQHSVSQHQKHIGLLTEANYRGNAWITLGEGDDSRGIAWSDTELSILRGGVVVSRIKLNKVEVSTSQISPELS